MRLRQSEDVQRLQSRTEQNRTRKEHYVDDRTAKNMLAEKSNELGDRQKELDIVLTFHDKLKRLAWNQRTVARREEKFRRDWTVQLRVVLVVSVHTQKLMHVAGCRCWLLRILDARISTEHNY